MNSRRIIAFKIYVCLHEIGYVIILIIPISQFIAGHPYRRSHSS